MTTPDLSWVPSPADVRSVMAQRPNLTDAAIQPIINRTVGALLAEIPLLETRWFPVAKQYVIFATAALIEGQQYPEQQFGEGGMRDWYDRQAGAELSKLRIAYDVGGDGAGGGTGGVRGRVRSLNLRAVSTTEPTTTLPVA
jgi:hypothetical protein